MPKICFFNPISFRSGLWGSGRKGRGEEKGCRFTVTEGSCSMAKLPSVNKNPAMHGHMPNENVLPNPGCKHKVYS